MRLALYASFLLVVALLAVGGCDDKRKPRSDIWFTDLTASVSDPNGGIAWYERSKDCMVIMFTGAIETSRRNPIRGLGDIIRVKVGLDRNDIYLEFPKRLATGKVIVIWPDGSFILTEAIGVDRDELFRTLPGTDWEALLAQYGIVPTAKNNIPPTEN